MASPLAPYVASVDAYDVDLGGPGVHRGLPSTTVTFVLPVGEPLDVGWAGITGSRGRRWSTVSGLGGGIVRSTPTPASSMIRAAHSPTGRDICAFQPSTANGAR